MRTDGVPMLFFSSFISVPVSALWVGLVAHRPGALPLDMAGIGVSSGVF